MRSAKSSFYTNRAPCGIGALQKNVNLVVRRNLSIELKKKYPNPRESCEEGIVKLRNAMSNPQTPVHYVVNQIMFPVQEACKTKDPRVVRLGVGVIQRLVTQQVVDLKCAAHITDTLWGLMEAGVEEVKVLQTVTLLLTTNAVVHGDTLARNLVLCFRLHFAKDSTTINTAGATVRQLISLVFERVVAEDNESKPVEKTPSNLEELKVLSSSPPKGLRPCAADAYLMFQDLVQLVNADQPYWLIGMTEMTRTFGLELLESVLYQYSSVFFDHPEFSFLLKERVCALVIKLFSPNIKYRNSVPASVQQASSLDKPYFPISMRLLRVVSILIQRYHCLLVTECEIFLSLIVKFLDPDKPCWQRSLALEVLHKLCVQPMLLESFCECYDLKAHATKIFRDIVNSLGAFVQSLFVHPQLNPAPKTPIEQSPALLAGMPVGPGVTPQPGFYLRGVWLPLAATFVPGQAKSTYLDMLDRIEPPGIPEGYGISVAYAALLDVIRSISLAINGPSKVENAEEEKAASTEESEKPKSKAVHAQLINSSWCGLLAALSPLLEASTDEIIMENVLQSMQTFSSLCGQLEINTARDAFITAICKASLPPHYALSMLNIVTPSLNRSHPHDGHDSNMQYNLNAFSENDFRQQVVAVGTPLPSVSWPAGAQQGPVMLTSKNLQCMRALLSLAHCHGSILGASWYLILTTLQHLVWILGLKPSTGGSLKAGRSTADSNAVITTAVMADLPVLSAMLSRLFESSQYLDEVALHHLVDALCKLSREAMELAYSNREPSLFAVAKLLETGLVNLPRVEVLWRPLTNHLLEVCHHPHIRMREWGVEAVTYLVKAALLHKYKPPLKDNKKLQTLLLSPLAELSAVPHTHGDVRQKQLECVLQILHSSGEILSHGWPLVLGIIGAVNDQQGEVLIRLAFQCLQLVITDFLPVMPWRCLPLCVDTAVKFGFQTQELNISLTAVGLMWNISDYFYQNQDKLSSSLNSEEAIFPEFPGTPNMPPFDKLWMCLYARLGDLCVDPRPSVRKSAGQTLFSTLSAHGVLLRQPTLHAVLWQVLFPLLDKVRSLSSSASSEKVDPGGNILIHHSRNTAQKQWAETQVMTLSNVVRVFNSKRQLLQSAGDFTDAWSLLLGFIEYSSLNKNNEVSLSGLKCLQEMLYQGKGLEDGATEGPPTQWGPLWAAAWTSWLRIGEESTFPPPENEEDVYVPTQAFLAALVQTLPALLPHAGLDKPEQAQLGRLLKVLHQAVAVPSQEYPPFQMLTNESALSPLQDAVINTLTTLQNDALIDNAHMESMLSEIFQQLLTFVKFACVAPQYGNLQIKSNCQMGPEWGAVNYVPFGEKCLSMAVKLFLKTAEEETVIKNQTLQNILESLRVPLSMKYSCPSQTTWKAAITKLLGVLHVGLPIARRRPEHHKTMWPVLAETLDLFLFPKVAPPPSRGLEEIETDEAVDCQVIEQLRDEVLPHAHAIPKEFVLKVVVLLNKGSIHSATHTSSTDYDCERKLREEFAKICFETLLQFSLLDNNDLDTKEEGGVAGRLAVTALLLRFQDVLKQYVDEERSSGQCPLPRYRLAEVSFVLKAVATLVMSLKKAPPGKVDKTAWEHLIGLYPYLVNCTSASSSPSVLLSLREALLQFTDLIQPPSAPKSRESRWTGGEGHHWVAGVVADETQWAPDGRQGVSSTEKKAEMAYSVGQPRFTPFKVSQETLANHTKVLSNGAVGVNFHELAAPNLANSAVLRMLEEEERAGGGIKRVTWPPPPSDATVVAAQIEQPRDIPNLQGDLVAQPPATLLFSPPPQQEAAAPSYPAAAAPGGMEAPVSTCVFTIPSSVAAPSPPPPASITLRAAAPVTQAPPPVVRSQPAVPEAAFGRRGDAKWPPQTVRVQRQAEEQQRAEIAKGPAFRPRRPQKDYSSFFEQNKLLPTYSHYRAPPGTQHYPVGQ
ncbi:Hypothetical predicted protein [Cloeon dipterum]|uniref:Protein MON2 homolog n=1 Tax=Cloeon dipterum TaxID=197152 RepID=A0A8S1DIN5_9INSE|nr:Hypothetical predicted protein [Cloeon dipterum]